MHKERIEFGLGWSSNRESILENFGDSGSCVFLPRLDKCRDTPIDDTFELGS
jgi:hypothetical protein